jgi:hypothetical protein
MIGFMGIKNYKNANLQIFISLHLRPNPFHQIDSSINYYPQPYCDIVNDMPKVCLELSILELWANDGDYEEKTEQELIL